MCVEVAKSKASTPSTIMSFLGVLFNNEKVLKKDNRNLTRKITRNTTAIISMVR